MANIVISDTLAQNLQDYAETNCVSIETAISRFLDDEVRRQASKGGDAKYHNLIMLSPAATFISRPDDSGKLQFIYCNPATIALVGAKGEKDLIGKHFLDFISPLEHAKLSQQTQRYIDGKSLSTMEYHIQCLDRTSKYVRVSSITIDYDGSSALMSVMADITDQYEAEIALRQERNLLLTLLDNLPYEVYVKDPKSRFVIANRATLNIWEKDSLDEIVGKTDFDFGAGGDPVMSQFYYDQEQRIFETGQPVINHEVEPAGDDQRYLSINKYPVFDASGDITQIVCINFDVTNFKNTEKALREKEETARAFQKYLQNLHEITLELSQAETLDHLYRRVIELGREKLGFDRLGLWMINSEQHQLRGTYGTDEQGNLCQEYDVVRPIVEEMTGFEIIRNKERILVQKDVTIRDNDNQPMGKGWHAVAILWNGKEGIGWLSADNYLSHAPLRPYESDLLSAFGTAIGHLITQKKVGDALRASEETARAFQEYLRALHHIALELSQIEIFDDFYRRVIELGREKLGFDRLGLWLFMPDGKSAHGTFGTDEEGNLRDERKAIHIIEDDYVDLHILQHNKDHVVFVKGNVIRDAQHNIVGNGWGALVILRNGNEGIGWLSTDNLLSQSPPRPYEEDLLSTYSNVVGHLISRKRAEEVVRQSEENSRAFQEKLRMLHDITLELSQIKSFDDFYQQAIELGRKALGFDRLSLWRVSEARQLVSGTFGTDEVGRLRDERQVVFPLSESESGLLDILRSKGRIYVREKGDIRNEKLQVIGYGWSVVAVIWDGVEGIGWLSADNYLSHAEPRSYEFDLLIIYANALGNLIAQHEAQEQLQRLVDRLTMFSHIDHAILLAKSPETIANNILLPLRELVSSDYVSITIVDEEQNKLLRIAHTDTDSNSPKFLPLSMTTSHIKDYKQGKTRIVRSLKSPRTPAEKHLHRLGIQSCAVVPMMHNNDILGLVVIGYYKEDSINDVQISSTQQVAIQLAIALRQSLLYQQVKESNEQLEAKVNERTQELEAVNKELESFAYSVSHDLRAPLRGISGFSQVLLEDYEKVLDAEGQDYLHRVISASQRMEALINDLLNLSRISRQGIRHELVDISALANDIATELAQTEPDRDVQFLIAEAISAMGDTALLRIVLTNLMSNAWKFTRNRVHASIEVNYEIINDEPRYIVKDNGAGFDMQYANKLFVAFQRLHRESEFEGTGIGLATVQRIIHRHGGRIWAEGAPDEGATFYFTLR